MIKKIQNIYSGTKWEEEVAYCRAKRVGNMVFVSGTTAVDENGNIIGDSVYLQSKFIFRKIENALKLCGANISDVVRTRTFITNIDYFLEFALAHKEVFFGVDPVATCVEVSRLVNDKMLIEIEVDAIIQ